MFPSARPGMSPRFSPRGFPPLDTRFPLGRTCGRKKPVERPSRSDRLAHRRRGRPLRRENPSYKLVLNTDRFLELLEIGVR